jgi:vanillate O-demethylase ferredoxin subunit
LLGHLQALWRADADFTLAYCARSASHAAFLGRLTTAPYAMRTTIHLDDGPAAQRLQVAQQLAGEDASQAHIYVCGPKGFIDHVCDTARAQGWPEAHIHVEHFAPAAPVAGQALSVQVASTGQCIQVPANESITQALARHGVHVPVSCEQGICGTCVTRVIAGDIEHHDAYFTDAERASGDQITPCCSRGRGTLVLDL